MSDGFHVGFCFLDYVVWVEQVCLHFISKEKGPENAKSDAQRKK